MDSLQHIWGFEIGLVPNRALENFLYPNTFFVPRNVSYFLMIPINCIIFWMIFIDIFAFVSNLVNFIFSCWKLAKWTPFQIWRASKRGPESPDLRVCLKEIKQLVFGWKICLALTYSAHLGFSFFSISST